MLNQTHVEGYVTKKIWQYGGDTFFRLAVYRDPDLPRKETGRNSNDRDKPDYVTVKVPASLLAGLPVQFTSGQRIQVHGWLESREYESTLAEFLKDARESELEIDPAQAQRIVAHRSTTWITAARIVSMPDRGRNKSKTK